MPKPEWGVKRTCLSCAARFYDLMRDPIICPNCGAEFDVSSSARAKSRKAVQAAPVAAAELEEEVDLVEEDADDGAEGDDTALPDSGDEEIETEGETPTADVDEDDGELGDFGDDTLLENDDDDTESLEGLEEVSDDNEETN
ncbi:MAG: TIGR02300 family protein [Pikeienuella sp.]